MYCHARLDRAPDDVFCSAAARERHNQIGLAFLEHPLIAQWASFFAELVSFALREPIRFARYAPAPRPIISYPVSAARISVDQHREGLFGVQPIQDADYQPHIVEVATATDQNSHPSCPPDSQYQYKMLGAEMRAYAHNLHLILPARTSAGRIAANIAKAAGAIPQRRLVIQFPQSQKNHLRITPGRASAPARWLPCLPQ